MGESRQGMILDWELFKEVAPNDARLVSRSLKRVEQNLDIHVAAVAADRGFDSESNQQFLEEGKSYNGICPRSDKKLKQRKRSWKFTCLQRRRSDCEERIGIGRKNFLGQLICSTVLASRTV